MTDKPLDRLFLNRAALKPPARDKKVKDLNLLDDFAVQTTRIVAADIIKFIDEDDDDKITVLKQPE